MRIDLTMDGPAALFQALASGTQQEDGKRPLDHAAGQGYLQAIALGPRLRGLLFQLELRQELVLVRRADPARDALTFSFRNLLAPAGRPAGRATVQVMSAGMDLELTLPAHTPVNTLLLIAAPALFSDLLAGEAGHTLFQALLAGNQPFVYEEPMSPTMQQVVAAFAAADVPAELRPYYQRVKAEELLCLFLAELVKRGSRAGHAPLSGPDVRQLYQVRDHLLQDLGQPPSLAALARSAAWSESKLKRLFKQVFGLPVYQYYQAARLQEAARLLRTQQLSVSEVGYQLGFQNLSHFTQLFTRHTGSRPKQFSKRHTRPDGKEA